jgi:Ca2+-dependent lipid-binding protein
MASIDISPFEADIVRDVSSIGKMDPYCKVYIGSVMKTMMPHTDGSRHPRWNESVHFGLQGEESIKIEVWDRNSVTSDELIGTANYTISQVKA